jgi:hypothetical protein
MPLVPTFEVFKGPLLFCSHFQKSFNAEVIILIFNVLKDVFGFNFISLHIGDKLYYAVRLEVFTAICIMAFWTVTLCSGMVGYQCVGGPCFNNY